MEYPRYKFIYIIIIFSIFRKAKKHLCQDCGKRFYDSNDLRIHQRTHSGEKPFECLKCNKLFADSRVLNQHSKIHSGKAIFDYLGKLNLYNNLYLFSSEIA